MDFRLVPRGTDWNYTGFLTKTIVYSGTLVFFLALRSTIPYGLHKRCSSLTDICESFPQREDCHGDDRYFCSMWRSVGFLMSFAVVLQGMSIVTYMVILLGGKRLRENGWRLLSLLIVMSAFLQAASMSIVAYLYDNEDRFFVGWNLDESWVFCTVSWCLGIFCAGAIVVAAQILPSEGGYELIPDNDALRVDS
ncbi:hypothetical protein N7526_002490 [Penicillium atrosanguineum]|nr:hypothetical protein N7526_002490 [Penicillium atrosanguineum]